MTKEPYLEPKIESEVMEPDTLLVAGSPVSPNVPGVKCKVALLDDELGLL